MLAIDFRDLRYCIEEDAQIYQDDPFTGIARQYNHEGALVAEYSYVNGDKDGLTRYWYPSGELLGEDHYRNASLHGPSREWYQNGQLKREAEYELSILVKDKKWDECGKLVEDFVLTENDPLFKTLQDFWDIYGKNLPK